MFHLACGFLKNIITMPAGNSSYVYWASTLYQISNTYSFISHNNTLNSYTIILFAEALNLGTKRVVISLRLNSRRASQVVLMVKNLPANADRHKRCRFDPGLGRSPGGGHSNPPQYSCLKSPMDRGAWWAMIQWVTWSWTWLKWLKWQGTQKPLDESERGEWKSWLKAQHSEN